MLIESAPRPNAPTTFTPAFKLFSGPSPYVRVTPWRWISIVGTLVVLLLVLVMLSNFVAQWNKTPTPPIDTWEILIYTPIQQLVMIGIAFWAVHAHRGRIVEAMALKAPAQGWKAYVVWALLYTAIMVALALALTALQLGDNSADEEPFKLMFASSGW